MTTPPQSEKVCAFVGLVTRVTKRFQSFRSGGTPPISRPRNPDRDFYVPDSSLTAGLVRKSAIRTLCPCAARGGQHSKINLTNRADSGANAASTEGEHGRMGKPAVSKSLGIQASNVRGRDKALRFPMGKMYRRHVKSIPRLPYTESEMRAPDLGALRPLTANLSGVMRDGLVRYSTV